MYHGNFIFYITIFKKMLPPLVINNRNNGCGISNSSPIPKHPFPWTIKFLSREQASCNQDTLAGLAVLELLGDSWLSEILQVVPPRVGLGPGEFLELKWKNK